MKQNNTMTVRQSKQRWLENTTIKQKKEDREQANKKSRRRKRKELATRLIKGKKKRKPIYTHHMQQSNIYHWIKQRVHVPTIT
eukprot:14838702-Ditylum_brightwellii.AAC.1